MDRAFSFSFMDADPIWETRMVIYLYDEDGEIIRWGSEEQAKFGHLYACCFALFAAIKFRLWRTQISP